ncbi:MAG: branched-chain amino acid ABC transporter permease [Acidimicrobiia bacterium]
MAGLEFNPEVIGPTLVLGMAAAGLYGLLATALVMTYRVSRTIGFVHGGLALLGTYAYWWLTYPEEGAAHARMGRLPGMLLVVAAGAVIGVAYGSTVTGRLANWPRVRLTIYSLGWLLALAFATTAAFVNNVVGVQGLPIPSLFGTSTYTVFGAVVTIHQVATVAILVALIAVLSVLLLRTRTGTYIRAIADDPEAGRWVGIPLHWVGTGVFGLSGAVSTFAGVLLASTVGINFFLIPVVFLRALTVSVLGGFTSLPLALVGCLVLGVGEASLGADLFGTRSPGEREIIVMAVLFGLVFLINRYRRVRVIEVTGM